MLAVGLDPAPSRNRWLDAPPVLRPTDYLSIGLCLAAPQPGSERLGAIHGPQTFASNKVSQAQAPGESACIGDAGPFRASVPRIS